MSKKLKVVMIAVILISVIAVIGVPLGLFLPRDADGIGIEEYLDSEILSVRVTYRRPDYSDMELRDVSEVRILMESLQNATFYRRFPSHRAKTGVLPERLEIQNGKRRIGIIEVSRICRNRRKNEGRRTGKIYDVVEIDRSGSNGRKRISGVMPSASEAPAIKEKLVWSKKTAPVIRGGFTAYKMPSGLKIRIAMLQ